VIPHAQPLHRTALVYTEPNTKSDDAARKKAGKSFRNYVERKGPLAIMLPVQQPVVYDWEGEILG
jgi:hypothetical protein